jgi:hypothetical protein
MQRDNICAVKQTGIIFNTWSIGGVYNITISYVLVDSGITWLIVGNNQVWVYA